MKSDSCRYKDEGGTISLGIASGHAKMSMQMNVDRPVATNTPDKGVSYFIGEAMRLMILLFVTAALGLATIFLSGFPSANFLQQLATLNPASKGLLTVSLLVSTAALLLLCAWAKNGQASPAKAGMRT